MDNSLSTPTPPFYYLLDEGIQIVGRGKIADPAVPLDPPQEFARQLIFNPYSSVEYYRLDGKIWFVFSFAKDLDADDVDYLYENCRTPEFVQQLAALCGGTCLLRWGGPREEDAIREEAEHTLILYAHDDYGEVELYSSFSQPLPSYRDVAQRSADLRQLCFQVLEDDDPLLEDADEVNLPHVL